MFRHSSLILRKHGVWRLLSIAVAAAMLGALLLPVPGMAIQADGSTITLSSKEAPACPDDPNASCISTSFKAESTHRASYIFDCSGDTINIPIEIIEVLGLPITYNIPTPACTLFALGSEFSIEETPPGTTTSKEILRVTYPGKHEGDFEVRANHTYTLTVHGHGLDFRGLIGFLNLGTFDSFAKVTYRESDPADESCEDPFPIDPLLDPLQYWGKLEFDGDHDWQRIKSNFAGTMVLKLNVPDGKDYQLEVRKDDCSAPVGVSINGKNGEVEYVVTPVDSDVYFRVHVYGNTPADWDADTSYEVTAMWGAGDLEDNRWKNAADFNIPYEGNLEYGGDHDWQRVYVPTGDLALVLDVPVDKNYQLEVWRDDIESPLGSSVNDTGMDESLMISQPGYYRVHVFGADVLSDFNAPYRVFLNGDDIAPTSTISIAGTMGNNGWYRSDIVVTLSATDDSGSGVQKTEYGFASSPDTGCSGPWYTYTVPIQGTLEGSGYLVFRSIDNAGNVEPCQSQFIGVDKTPPAIDVHSPQSMDYLHSEVFEIRWKPFDKPSGVETSFATLDGQPVTNRQMIDLLFLKLGPHMVTIQANDYAGNNTTLTVPFNVVADIDSLHAVTQRAYDLGWITKQSTYKSLDAALQAAKQSIEQGNLRIARRQLLLFLAQLRIYNDTSINQQAYDLLRTDALYVLLHLP